MLDLFLIIFLPIIVGYILVKVRYISSSISKDIKTFVIKVAVPCRIFISIQNSDYETLKQIIPLSSSLILITLFLILISYLILFKVKDNATKATYMIAICFGNYGYIGWGVLNGALGQPGLTRGIFFTTLWWPMIYAGTFLIGKMTRVNNHIEVKRYLLNIITPVFALLLGVVFNIYNIPIYNPILALINSFGDMTVTLILFSVGLTISITHGVKNIKRAIVPVLLRPLLGVVTVLFILIIMQIKDPISRKVLLINSTMPTAVISVILGEMLELDGQLLSSILVLSTLFSFATIPLTIFIFG